jgi:hypothetical protein
MYSKDSGPSHLQSFHVKDPNQVIRENLFLILRDLEKECEAVSQILGNNYLQTGFYELGINTFYRLYQKDKTNPFLNL